ncbi:MAG: tetratricopeptide repeat protein, partial [Thermodesulfobacteria bacterium]|nr:tetratricopeptide repeat protein [Thermodesulfobacteriota bacterium]
NGFFIVYPILRHFVSLDEEAKLEMLKGLEGIKGLNAGINRLFLSPKEEHLKRVLDVSSDGSQATFIAPFIDHDLISKQLEEISDDAERASAQNNLGNLYSELGDLTKAREYYEKALEIREALSKENRGFLPYVATTQNNLGALYSDLGDLTKAREYYEKALELYEALCSENRGFLPNVATTQNNLGNLYTKLGELTKAREYYEKALIIFNSLGERSPVFYKKELQVLLPYMILLFKQKRWQEAGPYFCRYFELLVLFNIKETLEFLWLKENATFPSDDEQRALLDSIEFPTCKEKTKELLERVHQFFKQKEMEL